MSLSEENPVVCSKNEYCLNEIKSFQPSQEQAAWLVPPVAGRELESVAQHLHACCLLPLDSSA